MSGATAAAVIGTSAIHASPPAPNDGPLRRALRWIDEQGLVGPLGELASFFDEIATCAGQEICDAGIVRALFGQPRRRFLRTFAPYICEQRRIWNDAGYARTLEAFFGPAMRGKVCEGYARTHRASGASGRSRAVGASRELAAARRHPSPAEGRVAD